MTDKRDDFSSTWVLGLNFFREHYAEFHLGNYNQDGKVITPPQIKLMPIDKPVLTSNYITAKSKDPSLNKGIDNTNDAKLQQQANQCERRGGFVMHEVNGKTVGSCATGAQLEDWEKELPWLKSGFFKNLSILLL